MVGPVPATTPVTTGPAYVQAPDLVVRCVPTLTTTLSFTFTPAGTLHTTLLSATHTVASHAVPPTLPLPLLSTVPYPLPGTGMMRAPVVGPVCAPAHTCSAATNARCDQAGA